MHYALGKYTILCCCRSYILPPIASYSSPFHFVSFKTVLRQVLQRIVLALIFLNAKCPFWKQVVLWVSKAVELQENDSGMSFCLCAY